MYKISVCHHIQDRKVENLISLEANLNQIHGLGLHEIQNFNSSGLQMIANIHFVPPRRRLYELLDLTAA